MTSTNICKMKFPLDMLMGLSPQSIQQEIQLVKGDALEYVLQGELAF